MFDIQKFLDNSKIAGFMPSLIIIGGWIYTLVLLLVALYYFLLFIKRTLINKRK